MQRYLSVDILRGVAILLMIQVHFVSNLSPDAHPKVQRIPRHSTRVQVGVDSHPPPEPYSAWLYDVSSWLGVLPAPLFTFVSGLSFCLWTRKQEAKGQGDEAIVKVAIRRGLFLFGTGLAFNVFVWLPEDTFDWDILTLLGASFLILAFARKLPSEVLALICVLVLLLSPLLRDISDYSAYWEGQNYSADFTLTDVLLGFFCNGYFPLFPWIIFPLSGFIIGDFFARNVTRTGRATAWLAGTGSVLMSLAVFGFSLRMKLPKSIAQHDPGYITMYPGSTVYVLGTLGFSIVSLALLHAWLDRRAAIATGYVSRFFQRWSAFSLTIYLVHHMAHIWPLWLYGEWQGKDDPTYYYQNALRTPLAFGLAIAFVVVCTPALCYLEKHKGYSFEALMRWLCD